MATERLKDREDSELLQIIKVQTPLLRSRPRATWSFSQSRGIRLQGKAEDLTGPHPAGGKVHLASDGVLVWPVLLLYPEYGQSDYIMAFREHDRLCVHIHHIVLCVS